MASFTVDTKELDAALTSVIPIVPNKPSRDVLKCIKIKAHVGQEDYIEISATDLETYVSVRITTGVMVQNAGEFVVPAQIMNEYIKSLDSPTVDITLTNESIVKINEAGTEFEVGIQDIDEFPDFPAKPTNQPGLDLAIEDVILALGRVIFAVADKGHPRWGALSAVCFEISADKVTLIGTDQHRASLAKIEIETKLTDKQYLVNAKAIALLPKVFSDSIKLYFTTNSLVFNSGNNYMFVRLMHGNFPPVRNFVPAHTTSLSLDPRAFLKQVKKAALAADEYSSLKIVLKDKKVSLLTKTRIQRKVAKIEYEIENYSGPDFEFALNCKYLIDLLKAANPHEDLEMKFNKNHQPILFKQSKFDHVMVPVEVK